MTTAAAVQPQDDRGPRSTTRAGYARLSDTQRGVSDPERAVVTLLTALGEDPARDGLVDTPARVVRALGEMTAGYRVDVAQLLAVTFDEHHDELIVVRRVPFNSLCEHHLLPFTGVATVGYVPRAGIVGLSKLARLVDVYARRLQVQERMTDQIADALVTHLDPLAVGVVVEAVHSCMAMRGVERTAPMVTSCLRGLLRERPDLRAEFLSFAGYSR
jgi:GTP cyclohydrolase IA